MATITASPSISTISYSGNSAKTGTMSWTKPTVPSGATISSCKLTGTCVVTASSRQVTVTVNGTTVANKASSGNYDFEIDLGTSNNTTSVTVAVTGSAKQASGTVSFSNLVYTVTYTEPVAKPTYTVTFKNWDGTVLKTQTIEEGSSATAPSNPSRTGYTFTGWDKTFTNVTSDLTVTAQFTINSYTVTFKDHDGTTLETQTVNYGSNAAAPSNPTRDGYNFIGWDKAFNNITSDLTITAQYTKIETPEPPSGELVEKTEALRPISVTQDSGYNNTWTNVANTYDTDTSTAGTISITGTSQGGFVREYADTIFNFDTSHIPANAIINSATLTVRAKSSSTSGLYITADANGDSSKNVINNVLLNSTSSKNYTGNIADYVIGLSNLKLRVKTTGTSTRTFTLYDVRIDLNYSVYSDAELLNTVIINSNEDWGYVKNLATNEIYTGTNITVTGPNTEAIDLMIYPNEGYHIAAVYEDFFGEDIGPFTQYPCGLEASVGSNTQTYTYIVTYAKNEGPEESKTQNLVIGDMIIDELFIGGQEIEEIYIGDNLLFKK